METGHGIISLALIQVGSCQLLAKSGALSPGYRLGSLPRKSVVRLTDRLDMTIVVDRDVKPQKKIK